MENNSTASNNNNPTDNPPPSSPGSGGDAQVESAKAVLVFTTLMLSTLIASYILQRMKVRVIHESIIAISLGIITGLIIHYGTSGDTLERLVTFDHRYFFNLLRPPMILSSGYELDVQRFYKSMGTICLFAFLGSFISTGVIGVLLYVIVVLLPFSGLQMSFLQCLIFGTVLSSTDPIPILALLKESGADIRLHTIIFGESVLNNAVSIVSYNILDKFNRTGEVNIMHGFFLFLAAFVLSLIVGVVIGLLTALLLKFTEFFKHPAMESCVVILTAYVSYLFSSIIGLSGIVSLLFTGITMKRYVYHNLSPRSRTTTTFLFKLMAYLAENFIFIYLGLSLFTHEGSLSIVLIILTFGFVLVARALTVFPLAYISNWFSGNLKSSTFSAFPSPVSSPSRQSRRRQRHQLQKQQQQYIPRNHQMLLWWSGMRGAIAVGLCMIIEAKSLREMRSTTLIVVILTILAFGGTSSRIIKYLDIIPAVEYNEATLHVSDSEGSEGEQQENIDSEDDEDDAINDEENGEAQQQQQSETYRNNSLFRMNWFTSSSFTRRRQNTKKRWNFHRWFLKFDRDFLVPLFTRKLTEQEFLDEQQEEFEIAAYANHHEEGDSIVYNNNR